MSFATAGCGGTEPKGSSVTSVTPGAADGGAGATLAATKAAVVISEIMYHPVGEEGPTDEHEFVELTNRTDKAQALGGWRLTGGKGTLFTFPAGTSLPARASLVVAQAPDKLGAVYKLEGAHVVGPMTGELDNDGEKLSLLDGKGTLVEEVRYSEAPPWPMGADALGAGEEWLPEADRPLERHKGKGRSLVRIDLDRGGGHPANWEASALDGATPGRPNGISHPMLPIVETHRVSGAMGGAPLAAGSPALLQATISDFAPVRNLRVELFVEDPESAQKEITTVPLTKGADDWQAQLAPQPESRVVRYRIRGDRGQGDEVLSPRAGDPYAWHGYFVPPAVPGATATYHLFLSKANWNQLYKNVAPGRVPAAPKDSGAPGGFLCDVNPTWDDRVPATLVASDGRVIDVYVRYQGSPFNRTAGPDIKTWPMGGGPGPDVPSPLKALSWNIKLPRYAPVNGRRTLILHKRANECNFVTMGAGGRLFESLGIPSPHVSHARLYINGVYYQFMSEVEQPYEEMVKRFFGKDHKVGDLFKSVGYEGPQGPFHNGDLRDIPPRPDCNQTAEYRFAMTYDRKAPEGKTGAAEVMKLSADLLAARANGVEAMRRFLADTFDLKLAIDYVALMNWLAPWDDFFQNFLLYKRGSDGKWMIFPWDFDNLFGTGYGSSATASFFVGEMGNGSNRLGWYNLLKDTIIQAYREELKARLRELVAKELSPDVVTKAAEKASSAYVEEEGKGSASGAYCKNVMSKVTAIKTFATKRKERVEAGMF